MRGPKGYLAVLIAHPFPIFVGVTQGWVGGRLLYAVRDSNHSSDPYEIGSAIQ